ncbi:hypothetical protein [Hydrococcus rivularis]|nr:hypothetical protein [Hydrococcus rivularis]
MIQPSATSDREKVCSEQKASGDRCIPISERLVYELMFSTSQMVRERR